MAVDLSILLRVECAFAYRALRGDEYLTGRDNRAVLSIILFSFCDFVVWLHVTVRYIYVGILRLCKE